MTKIENKDPNETIQELFYKRRVGEDEKQSEDEDKPIVVKTDVKVVSEEKKSTKKVKKTALKEGEKTVSKLGVTTLLR